MEQVESLERVLDIVFCLPPNSDAMPTGAPFVTGVAPAPIKRPRRKVGKADMLGTTFLNVKKLQQGGLGLKETYAHVCQYPKRYPLYRNRDEDWIYKDIKRCRKAKWTPYAKLSREEWERRCGHTPYDDAVLTEWEKSVNPGGKKARRRGKKNKKDNPNKAIEVARFVSQNFRAVVFCLSQTGIGSTTQPGVIAALLNYVVDKMRKLNNHVIPLSVREVQNCTGLGIKASHALRDGIMGKLGLKVKRSAWHRTIHRTLADEFTLSAKKIARLASRCELEADSSDTRGYLFPTGLFSVHNALWHARKEGVNWNVRYLMLAASYERDIALGVGKLAALARELGWSRSSSYRVAHEAIAFMRRVGITTANYVAVVDSDERLAMHKDVLGAMVSAGESRIAKIVGRNNAQQNVWRGYKRTEQGMWVPDMEAREALHPVAGRYILQQLRRQARRKGFLDWRDSRKREERHEKEVLKELYRLTKNRAPKLHKAHKPGCMLYRDALNHKDDTLRELAEIFIMQRNLRIKSRNYDTPSTTAALSNAVLTYYACSQDEHARRMRMAVSTKTAGNAGHLMAKITKDIDPLGCYNYKLLGKNRHYAAAVFDNMMKKEPSEFRWNGLKTSHFRPFITMPPIVRDAKNNPVIDRC